MTRRTYFDPICITGPEAAARSALPLAGGPLRFHACRIARRDSARPWEVRRETLPIVDLAQVDRAAAWLERLSAPRQPVAGLTLDRPRIMGIINVTPDSFSDGGDRFAHGEAVAAGLAMWEAGADILDVGGESTRPGAEPIDGEEERRRVLPVVERLADAGCRVSIDTRRAGTMRAALAAGARIVNDVTSLTWDPEAAAVVAEAEVPVVLMHMQGTPETMQRDPRYDDAALDVYDELSARVEACVLAGIPRERVIVDPGIGFGKTVRHNVEIVNRLGLLHGLGCPVMLALSRKSSIGRLSRGEPAKARLPGSLAGALAGVDRGIQLLRVHDVAETAQALAVWRAMAMCQAPSDPTSAPAAHG